MSEEADPALAPQRQELLRAMARSLGTLDLRRPHALACMVEDLAELMGFAFSLTYRPAATLHGSTIPEAWGAGIAQASSILSYFADEPAGDGFAAYDPLRPDTSQRNRVVDPRAMIPYEELRTTATAQWEIEQGLHHLPELRVLVCGRRSILGWVGGYREEPYGPADHVALTALVPALRRRLTLEARLALGRDVGGGLAGALDAVPTPAALVRDRDGTVAHANAAAQAAFAEGELDTGDLLVPQRGTTVTPLRGAGERGHSLVVLGASRARTASRIEARSRAWGLTRRQREVLALVADGQRNEVIAAELGIGLRAVERHVAALRRRAQVETRAELVGEVWHGA